MQIEKRGKYPGVKVHLNPQEVETITSTTKLLSGKFVSVPLGTEKVYKLIAKLGHMIIELEEKEPELLEERTPEQIRQTLIDERDKAIEKLKKIDAGKAWNDGKSKA